MNDRTALLREAAAELRNLREDIFDSETLAGDLWTLDADAREHIDRLDELAAAVEAAADDLGDRAP